MESQGLILQRWSRTPRKSTMFWECWVSRSRTGRGLALVSSKNLVSVLRELFQFKLSPKIWNLWWKFLLSRVSFMIHLTHKFFYLFLASVRYENFHSNFHRHHSVINWMAQWSLRIPSHLITCTRWTCVIHIFANCVQDTFKLSVKYVVRLS